MLKLSSSEAFFSLGASRKVFFFFLHSRRELCTQRVDKYLRIFMQQFKIAFDEE
jgi:hypothetical protein